MHLTAQMLYIPTSIFFLVHSGPVLAMVLEKPNAISDWRALIGPTDARKAKISHPTRSAALCFTFLLRILFTYLSYWVVSHWKIRMSK